MSVGKNLSTFECRLIKNQYFEIWINFLRTDVLEKDTFKAWLFFEGAFHFHALLFSQDFHTKFKPG